ncbi:hypothetical protein PGB90_000280 [Kerria lacca]
MTIACCHFHLISSRLQDTEFSIPDYHTTMGYQPKVNYREKEKEILDKILGQGIYDARIRPSGVNGTDGPAIVTINLFIRSITTISDVKMKARLIRMREKTSFMKYEKSSFYIFGRAQISKNVN